MSETNRNADIQRRVVDGEPPSQIAREYGITHQRVHQIVRAAATREYQRQWRAKRRAARPPHHKPAPSPEELESLTLWLRDVAWLVLDGRAQPNDLRHPLVRLDEALTEATNG